MGKLCFLNCVVRYNARHDALHRDARGGKLCFPFIPVIVKNHVIGHSINP